MQWLNSLLYPLQKLRSEVLLLVLASAWALLRLFNVVVGRVEKGKPLILKVLGVTLVEVGKCERLRTLREKDGTLHGEEFDTRAKVNLTFSGQTDVPDLSAKSPRNAHTHKKEVNTKHGYSS